MNMMNKPVHPTHAWNRPYLPAGGAERVFLLLELTGNAGEAANRERAPMNASLVLDRSGSMGGEPLAYAKQACRFVVDRLGGADQLSLVVFDSEVQTVFAPRTAAHKDAMKRHIESIHAGGTTNLSGGLLQGIQNVMQSRGENTVNRVILLSDGHANEGITEPAKLAAIAKEFHSLGIGVTTMGVGDGFDEELMERIADHGGGNFYFIEKPEEIPGIFARELEGLMSVTAQNATLKLRPSESARIVRVYGYPSEAIENGGLKLTLGDVYDQEVKSVLIEMAFDPHAAGRHEVLEVQWDYADVTDGARLCSLVYPIEAAFTNDIDLLLQPPNPHVEKKVQITESALAIEQAIEAFDRGDTETGKKLLQRQADAMLLAAIRSEDEELREEAQLLYSQLEQFEYSDKTRKVLHEQKYRRMKRKK